MARRHGLVTVNSTQRHTSQLTFLKHALPGEPGVNTISVNGSGDRTFWIVEERP